MKINNLEANEKQRPIAIRQITLFGKVSKKMQEQAELIEEEIKQGLRIENEWI